MREGGKEGGKREGGRERERGMVKKENGATYLSLFSLALVLHP